MSGIRVEHEPGEDALREMGVFDWPVWTREVSEFPWQYGERERCYILEGDVVVTPDGGDPVRLGPGDLVTFPRGLSCTWRVRQPVRKHYQFG